jgi:hypothetical protein
MNEHHADQEETVLAYVRLKSGAKPFKLYGDGMGPSSQAARKASKGKPLYSDNVIDLACERAKRLK